MSSNEIRHTHYDDNHHYHADHHGLIENDSIDLKCILEKEFEAKIRDLLNDLNRYSTKINQLEQSFQENNSRFQRVLDENSFNLKKIMKKCGERHITTSRPYYIALQRLNDLKTKCQIAALKFEKYNERYLKAKQAISEAESMFQKNMRDQFDEYWQEKLNIANSKFADAKIKCQEQRDEHLSVMSEITILESNILEMKNKNKNSIRISKPYFDEANNFDSYLKTIKQDIQNDQQELVKCKKLYSKTLKDLENISEEIHEKQAQYLSKSLKREPGVGAEIDQNCLSETLSTIELKDSKIAQTASEQTS